MENLHTYGLVPVIREIVEKEDAISWNLPGTSAPF